eukprot:1349391-Prymnesium_polylepis.1
MPGHAAGAQRAANRRRALAPLGARGVARTAAVHGARRVPAELQPPVTAALLRFGVWGARGCAWLVLRG